MRVGRVIACHNKVDDLLVSLEISKYLQFDHVNIIVHTMDYPDHYMQELKDNHLVRINGQTHYIATLLCAVAGVRKCHELGLDYCVYNNADDWLFNSSFEENNFKRMEENNYLCSGYSWLNVESYDDITLNQLYLHVPSFYSTSDDAEKYFKNVKPNLVSEYKLPYWVKKTCKDLRKEFYRLPGREQIPGVGYHANTLSYVFKLLNKEPPKDLWEKLNDNNRFFNRKWQLIGSHNNTQKRAYYDSIKEDISYHHDLETQKHFSRWLKGGTWNLPAEKSKKVIKPVPKRLIAPKFRPAKHP